MMDVSQIAQATVRTSVATIVAGDNEPHHSNCNKEILIFSLRGVVRFAGSERLTREITRVLGAPNPDDPGCGSSRHACAIVFSFRDVFSFNAVAQRIIQADITRLLLDGRTIVVIDPSGVLTIDTARAGAKLKVVESETDARDFIGGIGCHTVSKSDEW
ncbi:hypothetical protein NXS19_002240 [Fusarium pseudograminearum]|nr:hypothetical protein NXS19_002240 [Fusarium pseudograminearum]